MTRPHSRFASLIACAGLSLTTAAYAQPSSNAAGSIDPIRCWWRTSAGAVATGEPFDASLTCAVYDDSSTTVVADESRLGALAIQLGLFEVLGGSHPSDLRTGSHRFFQYHYTLRVIDRDAIGKDATFPDIHVSYRVNTRSGSEASEGRERTYIVPGQSIRVLSLVPGPAVDIRDTPGESFALVEALRFRSRALQLAALGVGALGVIVMIPALLGLARRGARTSVGDGSALNISQVLARVDKELTEIEMAARGGWTSELAARAASAIRMAASCALGRRFSHRLENSDTAAAGRLAVTTGLLRRRTVSAASSVTATDMRAAIDRLPLTTPAERRETLEHLQHALSIFTTALYRPDFEPQAGLDDAVKAARGATTRLRRAHAWPRGRWRSRPAAQPAESVSP